MSSAPEEDQGWSQAGSLEDVAALTADWLEGSLTSQPGYVRGAGPDPETESLIPVLAAVNRAGFLTTCSQPGHEPSLGVDGAMWAQRPAVEGFIHHGVLLRELVTRSQTAGLILLLEESPHRESPFPGMGGEVGVTGRDDQPYTIFGRRHNSYLEDDLCPTEAAVDIDLAVHLTLVDPEFRDERRLWEVLQEAVDAAAEHDDTMTRLIAPVVSFASTSRGAPQELTAWRANLEMFDIDGLVGDELIHVGFADFTVVRVARGYPIEELLTVWGSERAQLYSGLFEGDDLAPGVEAEFGDAMAINTVILIESVVIAELARGHDLGAWLVSEIVARMSGPLDTLVLMYPFPAVARTGEADELAAVTALTAHWAKAGLTPVPDAPMFLGAATGYAGLGETHERLTAAVDDAEVPVRRALVASPDGEHGACLIGAQATEMRDDVDDENEMPPGMWTLAHRGYSGSGRLDVWLFPTEGDALREGAALAMECGLDTDPAAVAMMAADDLRGVLDRYEEISPQSHLLRVQVAYLSIPVE